MKIKKLNIKDYLYMLLKSVLLAMLATILLSLILGYRLILVNGWSAEPIIKYQSLIITSKADLNELEPGDFITYSYTGKFYITHQIIAINKDGSYYQLGDKIDALVNGNHYELTYGYKFDKDGNCVVSDSNKDKNATTNCNIITLQRQYSNGEFKIDSMMEYVNHQKHVIGKVIYDNYLIGKTVFILKDNPLILVGSILSIIFIFVIYDQFNVVPKQN